MRYLSGGEFFSEARGSTSTPSISAKNIEPNPRNSRYFQIVRGFGYKLAERLSTLSISDEQGLR